MNNDFQKILLLGGSGFLGSKLKNDFNINNNLSPTHKTLDLTNTQNVLNYIYKNKPNIILYCAGVSKIDFAEKNKNLANLLNYKIPHIISKYAYKNKIKFVYFSTDAVFDGYKRKYIFEDCDNVNPKSYYGITKSKGEINVLNSNANSLVLRLINLYGISNNNFLFNIISNLQSQKEVTGIIDQINNPLSIDIASNSVRFSLINNLTGIYNLGSNDYISNYEFIKKIAIKFNLNTKLIIKINHSDFIKNKSGHRKRKSILNVDKFNKVSNNNILKSINNSINQLNL